MMAYDMRKPPTGSATFTTSERTERAARKRSTRLTEYEAEDLRYLWAGFSVDIGMRSSHGALEARLLLAPPREIGRPILEELERRADWVAEGLVLRIVTLEGWGVPGELRRALRRLVRDGAVERRAVPLPDVKPPAERTNAEQLRLDDWTGFEVRKRADPTLALRLVPLTREERWKRADEALEREWRLIHGNETLSTSSSYDPPENVQTSRVNRARRILAKLSAADAKVIEALYREHHVTEQAELDAVRSLVGGDDEAAREAIDRACRAFREARTT